MMLDYSRQYIKRAFANAVILAVIVDIVWVIREKSGWTPSQPNGSPKSWTELLDSWPDFLLSTLLAFSVVFLWSWWRGQDYFVCSGCQKAYDRDQIKGSLCPACSHSLEPVDGFYERHPEIADGAQHEKTVHPNKSQERTE